MSNLAATTNYALSHADYDKLEDLMQCIVSLGADAAWVVDRTDACLAIADREPSTTPGTTLARITETKVLRKALTEVEIRVATSRPLQDLGRLAMLLLAVDEVLLPHRRWALESQRVPRHRRR